MNSVRKPNDTKLNFRLTGQSANHTEVPCTKPRKWAAMCLSVRGIHCGSVSMIFLFE
jgi:hypothetical protein